MQRGTFIYVVMLAIFGTGLWAILSFGSILLRAPEDLAGEWQLYDAKAAPDADPLTSMSIEQSGRFFKVRFNGDVMDMKLIDEQRDTQRAQQRARLVLNGKTARLYFDGAHHSNAFELRATGAVSGTWLARRTSRPEYDSKTGPATTAPSIAPATAPSHARL